MAKTDYSTLKVVWAFHTTESRVYKVSIVQRSKTFLWLSRPVWFMRSHTAKLRISQISGASMVGSGCYLTRRAALRGQLRLIKKNTRFHRDHIRQEDRRMNQIRRMIADTIA